MYRQESVVIAIFVALLSPTLVIGQEAAAATGSHQNEPDLLFKTT